MAMQQTAQPEHKPAGDMAIIGASLPRIDGPKKTTGTALYTADFNFPGMVYAAPVWATIGSGRIAALDTSKAEKMPGVLRVYYHGHFPKVYRPVSHDPQARIDETRPPFDDDIIYYYGQYIACVIAETFEQASAAAEAIEVRYAPTTPNVTRDLSDGFRRHLEVGSHRGDTDAAFATAPVKVEQTYVTPIETHNPIEMHASVATWDGHKFKLYETTQAVMNHQAVLAQLLGVSKENMDIEMKFLGSGFGGKLWPWTHSPIAAAAARDLNRPVKFVLRRQNMFMTVGHRPRTQQRMSLGANTDGKLVALAHDYVSDTSQLDEVGENCGEATPFLYSTPNLRVSSAMVHRNLGTPTAMRGPGAVPGLFALESAMDELAIALKMDPVELRLKNEPTLDESNGLPFSSRHLKECLEIGRDKFGWSQRTPEVGSMKRDGKTLGWGMAACSWVAMRFAAKCSVSLNDDGTATITSGTQDIGTGTYTILAQYVTARTGVPIEKVKVVIGNSAYPPGPTSGGSAVTGSMAPAVIMACGKATDALMKIAVQKGGPFQGKDAKKLQLTEGRIHFAGQPAASGVPFEQALKAADVRAASGEGDSPASFADPKVKKYSTHSWGAQFVEVEWDPGIAHLRVSRVVSVIDVGRVINQKPARNQVEGAVVMGVGMAMLEETVYDQRNAKPVNDNLADYLVATSADCPDIDVHFTDYPDLVLNEFGARGVGEIGLAGVAPAITAAVYHATGVRVRELPIRIEDLLKAEQRT